MPIRKRLNLKGKAIVFVTTTVTDWIPVFSNEEAAEMILEQLRETANHFDVSIIAYVLMPSHLHLVLGSIQIETLSKFMQSFKSFTSRNARNIDLGQIKSKLLINGNFRLWKPRFDDLILVSEEQFRIKIDYIHNNPARAGIVIRPEDYKYSSAIDWMTNRNGLLPIDKTFEFLK